MSKSPFPGMDPYLEYAWRDVHQKLCVYACDDIQSQLGGGLVARVDERLVVEQPPPRPARPIFGDVQVIERPAPKAAGSVTTATGVALAEPIELEIPGETPTEGFIEISDPRSGGKVITVVEFLSPSNKTSGINREQYGVKRAELEQAGVSLVEINLLRAGLFTAPFYQALLEPEQRAPYYAIVHRGWMGPRYAYYPMAFEKRLSAIAIPVRSSDPVAALDLQSLIDRVYRNGAYDVEIDYGKDPTPPLDAKTAQWTDSLLREKGLR